MSLQEDIDALNQIPLTGEHSLYNFQPRDEESKSKFTKKQKSPRARGSAAHLESLCENNFFAKERDEKGARSPKHDREDDCFWKINALYNGNQYSNENIEQMIKERQERKKKDNHKSSSSDYGTAESVVSEDSQSAVETQLSKNVAYKGLVDKNIIHLSDLKISDNSGSRRSRRHRGRQTDLQPENDLSVYTGAGVPHPEIEGLMIHRFLAGIGAPEVSGVDYTVDRLTVRTFVSPKQTFMKVSDDDFAFVKKN